jgi:hypothetical protein
MGTAVSPPTDRARSIFDELGYDVAGDGPTFSATREWKQVTVSAVTEEISTPTTSGYRCFVTWADALDTVAARLEALDLDADWALIGVERDGSYEVARTPSV